MHKGREGKGLFPEEIDHVFQVIDALLAGHLMPGERILLTIELALEVLAHERRGELALAHRHGQAEREDRVDETVRIANTDITFPAEAAHLVRVVWYHMHLLGHVQLRDTTTEFGIDLEEIAPEIFLRRLLFFEEICPRRHHSHADNFLVDRD